MRKDTEPRKVIILTDQQSSLPAGKKKGPLLLPPIKFGFSG
jgi:hypothetical protein